MQGVADLLDHLRVLHCSIGHAETRLLLPVTAFLQRVPGVVLRVPVPPCNSGGCSNL